MPIRVNHRIMSEEYVSLVSANDQENIMHLLHILGVLFIVAWIVSWLALKITFAAIHALVVIGVVLLILGFVVSH